MAISKTQNERPAIIALIDAANALEIASNLHTQNIATLTDGLGDEISNRMGADAQLQSAIGLEVSNRIAAVTNVQSQIGVGFSSELTVAQSLSATNNQVLLLAGDVDANELAIQSLQTWQNRFRLGLSPSVTVEAGSSTSGTLSFGTPFEQDAEVAVFLVCVSGTEVLTDLSCQLNSATYSSFSFAVLNDSQADATVKVGFLAVRMN